MATFTGTNGNDNWLGTADADQAWGLDGDDILRGVGGDDEIDGGMGDDLILGGSGNDTIVGGGGNDSLRGEAGDDDLSGGDGNDFFRGGSGVDSFDGGADIGDGPFGEYGDRISFFEQSATQGVIADLRTGEILNDGFGNIETMTGIESLGADTAFADTLYGNDFRNLFIIGPGDSAYGFAGDDTFSVQGAPAVLEGGDGTDELRVRSDGGYFLPDSNGDGLAEIAPALSSGWTVNLFTQMLTDGGGNSAGFTGMEKVHGSHLADILIGDGNANPLFGYYGDDLIDGGAGADLMTGGWGADTFIVDDALDSVIEAAGGGIDEVRTDFLLYTLPGQVENFLGTYAGTGAAQKVIGNTLNNRLTGSAANDLLIGGDGHDALIGGIGVDILIGGSASDVMIGGVVGANLIVNGGFETQDGTNNTQQYIYDDPDDLRGSLIYRYASSLSGWISDDGTPFQLGTYNGEGPFSSADGNVVLDLDDGNGNGLVVHQDIAGLAAGATFLLSFSAALPMHSPAGSGPAVLLVLWNDTPLGLVAPSTGDMTQYHALVRASASGTGAGGANRLTFAEVGPFDQIGTLVDGVSLRAVSDDGETNWVSYDSEVDGGALGVLVNLSAASVVLNGVTVGAEMARDTHGTFDFLHGINAVAVASEADSWVVGGTGANHFQGGTGNDYFDGGGGTDFMVGSLGNDTYIVDSLDDTVYEAADAGTDEIRTGLGTGATLQQRVANQYQLAADVEKLTGTGLDQGLRGNGLGNVIAAGAGADFVNLRDGGADTVTSGDGRDVIYYGGAMTSADANDAGAAGGDPRGDLLILQGDYSAGLVLAAGSIVGIEKLRVLKGSQTDFGDTTNNLYSYEIETVDANVAAGAQLVVQGGSLQAGEHLTFDGSAEMDGSFKIFGGRSLDMLEGGAQADHLLGRDGDDHLIGNGGADRLRGGLGPDRLHGGGGADVFVYAAQGGPEGYANAVLESTGTGFDTIDGFTWGEDLIEMPNAVTAIGTDTSGALSQATFDADLAAALGSITAGSAVLFTPDSGDMAGRHFLVVDADGSGGYAPNLDFVIELINPSSLLPPADPGVVFV